MKLIIKSVFLLLLVATTTSTIHAITATPEQEAIYNQEIIDARSQATPAKQVQALTNIVNEQNNTAAKLPLFTSQNQLNFFNAIIPLAKQQTQDPATLNGISMLLQQVTIPANTMLQSGQKQYLTTKLLPAITQQASKNIPAPQLAQPAAIVPPAATKNPTMIDQTKKPTSQTPPITLLMIKNSLDQTTGVKQLRNVQAFLTLAEGFTFPSDIQDTFSWLIMSVANNALLQKNNAQDLKLALMQASTSSLLAPAQQAYVTNTLLTGRNGTQQAQPAAKKENKNKTKAKQQPQTTTQSASIGAAATKAPKQPKKLKAKKNKTNQPAATQTQDKKTKKAINKALKQTTTNAQISALLNLTLSAQGQQFMAATQDAFGNALMTIFKNRASYRSAEQLLLKKLLIKAQTTPLLSPAQQQYVTTGMMKQLE